MRTLLIAIPGLVVATLLAAACGSGAGTAVPGVTTSSTAYPAPGAATATKVLVNDQGDTLYFASQEAGGKVLCTGACARVWVPAGPSSVPAGTPGTGTVRRPGGSAQETLHGMPLYTFAFDGGPGHTKGNNVTDSFNGQAFTWHAATTVTGASRATSPTTAPATTVRSIYGY